MKHGKLLLAISLAFSMQPALAANVAVTDSGTDFEHEMLAGRAWTNTREVAGNLVDDDRNGKVDDVNGWNFVDNYDRVFVRDHLPLVHPVTYRLFQILAHQQAGTASPEEVEFWRLNVTALPDAEKTSLMAHLNYFGQYAHGTHVSGIVAQQNPKAKIMAARVFGDERPADYRHPVKVGVAPMGLMDIVYGLLASLTNGTFDSVSTYLKENSIDVANYSLGVPLKAIAKQFLALGGNDKPTDEQLAAETLRAYKKYEPKGRKWIEASPGTLFVIAAGNDASDNDMFPMFPSNIRAANAISVAATLGTTGLAKFSNYGKVSVDVAAPGVAIRSSVPSLDNKTLLPLSGTSMAAPYVAGVASQVKDLNPALTPAQIREILMETVDKKAWLAEKVIAGGVVNSDRAYMAAERSRTMPLQQALAEARASVGDQPESGTVFRAKTAVPADLETMANALVF